MDYNDDFYLDEPIYGFDPNYDPVPDDCYNPDAPEIEDEC